MMNRPFMAAWAFVAIATASPVSPATVFQATADGAQEPPPNVSPATASAMPELNDAQTGCVITTGVVDFDLGGPQTLGDTSDKVQGVGRHRTPAASSGPVFFGSNGADSDGPAPSGSIPGRAGPSVSEGIIGDAAMRPAELTSPFNDHWYLNAHTPGLPRR